MFLLKLGIFAWALKPDIPITYFRALSIIVFLTKIKRTLGIYKENSEKCFLVNNFQVSFCQKMFLNGR